MMKAPIKILLASLFLTSSLPAQDLSSYPSLPRYRYRDGDETLRAFAPVSLATRDSVVEINVNDDAVALGAVVESNLVLTKASQIKPGKLTCWLASGREVPAVCIATNDDNDVALLRVAANDLRPVKWENDPAKLGEWAVTPCLADTPQAAGIISAAARRIRPEHAFIGVTFNLRKALPVIETVGEGLGAAQAGLRPGDVIVAIDGAPMTNSQQVFDALGNYRAGQSVNIKIDRDGEEFDTNITLMIPRTGLFAQEWLLERRENRMGGEISDRSRGFDSAIEHDTVLQPWMCGGPVVDLDGRALGLNIARASRVATYALPTPLVQEILAKLKANADARK